eukprot:4431539-Lingulodinium_polyedra.AAC.1
MSLQSGASTCCSTGHLQRGGSTPRGAKKKRHEQCNVAQCNAMQCKAMQSGWYPVEEMPFPGASPGH